MRIVQATALAAHIEFGTTLCKGDRAKRLPCASVPAALALKRCAAERDCHRKQASVVI